MLPLSATIGPRHEHPMKILVLNSGSSSLKFRFVEVRDDLATGESEAARVIIGGAVSGIGGKTTLNLVSDRSISSRFERMIPDHAGAVLWVFEHFRDEKVDAVGHRVVHGGARFQHSVRIDAEVLTEIGATVRRRRRRQPAERPGDPSSGQSGAAGPMDPGIRRPGDDALGAIARGGAR